MIQDIELPAEQELDPILESFNTAIKASATSEEKIGDITTVIQNLNPEFTWSNEYSDDLEINLMANIVEGIYAPLITAYVYTIVTNVRDGVLPPNLYIPPRDGYPLIGAIRVIAQELDVDLNILPLKMYGLGPTLSFFRALFDSGNWDATANGENGFDPTLNSWWMIILDSIEEYGMSNLHKTVETLEINDQGEIVPVYEPVESKTLEVATATNWAVMIHAEKAMKNIINKSPINLAKKILANVPMLVNAAKNGLPVIFEAPVESMSNRDQHFINLGNRVAVHKGPGAINHEISDNILIEA
ncbi:MAG: hypothetical protein Q9M91_02350 [Candidatus Dojkabacteria bacterium]|nr:hypothetical protein [Candidatus Dojkabacteria bacterium]MDQ7020666.1 hypothetical protein [Candidatus Dojkabacteria bacterium]